MALHLIQQFTLRDTYTGDYTAGRVVKSFWDDVALAIKVYVYSSSGTEIGVQVTGPTVTGNYSSRQWRPVSYDYKFCDGTTLNYFTIKNNTGDLSSAQLVYPYRDRIQALSHFSCVSEVVCDIAFSVNVTRVVNDSGAGDGTITVSASTSYGTARYTRNPNDTYADAEIANSGTSHVFSALPAATYTIYAIDENGCKAQITVVVLDLSVALNYGVRWRLEYEDKFSYGTTRLDIEEVDYTGDITEIEGGADPIVQKWRGDSVEDIFTSFIACELEINLISRTHFEFFDLFTQNERQFRVKYYRDTGRIAPAVPETTGPITLPSLSEWQTTTADATLVDWTPGATPTVTLPGVNSLNTATSEKLFVEYPFIAGRDYEITLNFNRTINVAGTNPRTGQLIASDDLFVAQFTESELADAGPNTAVLSFTATESCTKLLFRYQSGSNSTIDVTSVSGTATTPAIPEGPAGFELKYVGFITPSLYSEQYYTTTNYNVSFIASDQIGLLKELDFTDDFGNEVKQQTSFLDAICFILRKTDLSLDVIESVNTYAIGFDSGASDSALQQAYFDPSIYYQISSEKVFLDGKFQTIFNNQPKKCDYVLDQLLKSFGARLYQADGYWRIELIEERSTTVNYREFTPFGILSGSGTFSSIVELKDTSGDYLALTERSGNLNMLPAYGKIRFEINNGFNNNLLTAGDFETRDIVNDQFRGWGFDITNGQGITYGYEKYKEPVKDSLGGLFVDFSNTSTGGKQIIIKSESFDLAAIDNVNLKFSFDILFRPNYEGFAYYVDYSIRIGDDYVVTSQLPVSSPGTLLIDGEYIRAYTEDALKWNTIERLIKTSQIVGRTTPTTVSKTLEGPVIIKIRVNNHPLADFESIADLRDMVTDNVLYLSANYKVNVLDGDTVRIYSLVSGTDADDSPDVIRPDDYEGTNNRNVWKLEKSLTAPDIDFLMNSVLIDNVILSVEREFDELAYEQVYDENNKLALIKEITHTDFAITSEDIENPESDVNLERAIKNLIRDSSGNATSFWGRNYVTDESRTLVDILMRMHAGQVTEPSMRISGSSVTNQEVSFSTLFYAPFLEKKFLTMYMGIHDFDRAIDVELLELKAGSDGEPPADIYEFTTEFTTEFDA
jgi:hypothetical protein